MEDKLEGEEEKEEDWQKRRRRRNKWSRCRWRIANRRNGIREGRRGMRKE